MTMEIKRQIQHPRLRKCCWLLIASLGAASTSLLAQQVSSTCPADLEGTGHKIHPVKLARLLQESNGLQKAADLAGHVSVDHEIRPITTFDLDGLIARSSLIVVGTITAKSSELAEDGNFIVTKYSMHVNTLLKGSVPPNGDVPFSGLGGCVVFANDTTAEISTIVWRYIEPGEQYLVFLYKMVPNENTFSITGGIEGLGKPTSQDGGFELAADLDKQQHHVISDRDKPMSIADLAGKIKTTH